MSSSDEAMEDVKVSMVKLKKRKKRGKKGAGRGGRGGVAAASAAKGTVRSTLLSFGEEEEGAAQDAAETHKLMQSERKRRRKEERKTRKAKQAIEASAAPSVQPVVAAVAAGRSYNAEAIAALKSNAIHFKPKPKAPNEPIVIPDDSEDEEGPELPTKHEIEAAKRKRERIRDGLEFIPLAQRGAVDESTAESASGLVREEDDDIELEAYDDNRGRRIAFGAPQRAKHSFEYDKVDVLEFVPDDEELAEYEDEQIARGGHAGRLVGETKRRVAEPKGKSAQPWPNVEDEHESESLEELMAAMQLQVTSVHEQQKVAEHELQRISNQLTTTRESLSALDEQGKAQEARYDFFQSLRDELADVLELLAAKDPVLVQLAEEQAGILRRKAEATADDAELGALASKAAGVLADAKDELQTPDHVARLLEDWKGRFPREYADAYVSLSVPGLMAPYVRVEMLQWQPLKTPGFEQFRWYGRLFSYGVTRDTPANDPDADLVPLLIDKIVVPRVVLCLELEWNPLVEASAAAAVKLFDESKAHVEHLKESTAVASLTAAVSSTLQRSVQVVPSPQAAVLARHVRMWEGRLAPHVLSGLVSRLTM